MENQIKNPKLSVAIVTYNHERFIANCLNSFLNFEYNFEFEVVIGDDCSTDNNRKIISQFAQRFPNLIRCLFYEKNKGGPANFQSVIEECRGEYIAHIDGDDMMLPGKLEKQIEFLDNHPECSVVAHGVDLIDEDGRVIGTSNDVTAGIYDINFLLERGTFFSHCSKMFRRDSIPVNGLDFKVKIIGDWHYSLQNAMKGKIGFLGEKLGLYRKHSMGVTARYASRQELLLKDKLYIIDDISKLAGVKPSSVAKAKRTAFFVAANNFLLQENNHGFRECIEKSWEIGIGFENRFHFFLYLFRRFPRLLKKIVSFKSLKR